MTPVRTRFLLADDDADDVSLFCEALEKIGTVMRCAAVENGLELFKVLSQDAVPPDVIFLDVNMPVMDGWECLAKLKGSPRYRDIPAIMYSTSAARRDIDKAYRLGALVFLTKPEDFRELCKILEVLAMDPPESLLPHLREFKSAKFQ